MIDLAKWRVPAGSLMVDGALVISLIYGGGKLTERLDDMGRRLEVVEQMKITPEADRRIAVQEAKSVALDSRLDRIEDLLGRIDAKLDRKADR